MPPIRRSPGRRTLLGHDETTIRRDDIMTTTRTTPALEAFARNMAALAAGRVPTAELLPVRIERPMYELPEAA